VTIWWLRENLKIGFDSPAIFLSPAVAGLAFPSYKLEERSQKKYKVFSFTVYKSQHGTSTTKTAELKSREM
jgi:hypothetical protein